MATIRYEQFWLANLCNALHLSFRSVQIHYIFVLLMIDLFGCRREVFFATSGSAAASYILHAICLTTLCDIRGFKLISWLLRTYLSWGYTYLNFRTSSPSERKCGKSSTTYAFSYRPFRFGGSCRRVITTSFWSDARASSSSWFKHAMKAGCTPLAAAALRSII